MVIPVVLVVVVDIILLVVREQLIKDIKVETVQQIIGVEEEVVDQVVLVRTSLRVVGMLTAVLVQI